MKKSYDIFKPKKGEIVTIHHYYDLVDGKRVPKDTDMFTSCPFCDAGIPKKVISNGTI